MYKGENIIILFTGLFRLSRRLVLLHLLDPLALHHGRDGDDVGGDLLVVLALLQGLGEHKLGGDSIVTPPGGVTSSKTPPPQAGLVCPSSGTPSRRTATSSQQDSSRELFWNSAGSCGLQDL